MRTSGQTIGTVLFVGGLVIGALIVAWLVAGLAESSLRTSGAILGSVIACLFIVFPLLTVGGFLFYRGRQEAGTLERVSRQRKLLGVVESAGEISIADLALETGGTRDSVRADLYDLVSKGLFSGYVDWNRGRLYSRQASDLRSQGDHCPNCGAEMSMAGKGMIRCNYCGAEVFLT